MSCMNKSPMSWADLVAGDPVDGTDAPIEPEVPTSPIYQSMSLTETELVGNGSPEEFTLKEMEEKSTMSKEDSSSSSSVVEAKKENMEEMSRMSTEEYSESQSSVYAYTAYELLCELDQFTVGQNKVQVADDSFITVNFKGKRCLIETPVATTVFGIKPYKTAGSKYLKYSLQISLGSNGTQEMDEFRKLLHKLDDWAKQQDARKGLAIQSSDLYRSAIRDNKKKPRKPPALEIKLPCYGKKCYIDVYTSKGKCIKTPSMDVLKNLVQPRTQVKCILAVNPIWRAGKKYGISYKLIKLKITEDAKNIEFR